MGSEPHLKHGHAKVKTREYYSWLAMKQRCLNPKNPSYKDYMGRGIKVCDRWLKFENFLEDMGLRPIGTSLDRKDNDGNYEPGNCKWSTRKEQASNQRGQAVDFIKTKGMYREFLEWKKLN